MTKSVWETLSKIDVNEHTEKKGNLTYLSWAWAWGTLKDAYPDATFEKHWFGGDGYKLPFAKDDAGAYVMVTVAVEDLAVTETMPVLDYKNKAVQNPDSFQVNTSLQRCLAKAIAYHGLGHYIYAGEDLPEGKPRSDKGKLYAPLGKSELAKQIKAFTGDIMACDDYDQLIALLNSGKELTEQCERDEPFWWLGGKDKHGEKFDGLEDRIENAKEKLSAKEVQQWHENRRNTKGQY